MKKDIKYEIIPMNVDGLHPYHVLCFKTEDTAIGKPIVAPQSMFKSYELLTNHGRSQNGKDAYEVVATIGKKIKDVPTIDELINNANIKELAEAAKALEEATMYIIAGSNLSDERYNDLQSAYNYHEKRDRLKSLLEKEDKKDFVTWLTEDALPATKDILNELRKQNTFKELVDYIKDIVNTHGVPYGEVKKGEALIQKAEEIKWK